LAFEYGIVERFGSAQPGVHGSGGRSASMSRYDELCSAFSVWDRAVTDYDEESISVVASFLHGLVAYLGVTEKEVIWFAPPGQKVERGQQIFIAGSRYTTPREGYAFTPALVIRSGSSTLPFQVPLEFYKEKVSDLVFTLRVFETDHQFSDRQSSTFEPVYESVVNTIKRNLLKPVSRGAAATAETSN
jgi:hypothetical protein